MPDLRLRDFAEVDNARQLAEMSIAGEQTSALVLCRGINNGVGGGQFVLAMQFSRQQGDAGIQFDDDAFLGVGDDFVCLIFAQLTYQPFGEFELHDGRHNAVCFGRKLLYQGLTVRSSIATRQPLDPRCGAKSDGAGP